MWSVCVHLHNDVHAKAYMLACNYSACINLLMTLVNVSLLTLVRLEDWNPLTYAGVTNSM